ERDTVEGDDAAKPERDIADVEQYHAGSALSGESGSGTTARHRLTAFLPRSRLRLCSLGRRCRCPLAESRNHGSAPPRAAISGLLNTGGNVTLSAATGDVGEGRPMPHREHWGWTVNTGGGVIAPDERLPWGQTIVAGMQHAIVMFGAAVLAPLLIGFD